MASALQQRTEELNESFEQESALRHRSSALYLVSQGLVVNSRLNDRLEVIAQALASICSAQRCAVFLRRGDHLAPVASWGWSRPECFPRLLVEIGENGGLVHEALLPGTPIVITDAANDPRVPPGIAEKFSIKGFLALPLVRKRHLVGLAVVDNPGEYPHFDEEAINTARSLSSLAAIAIENSESFEKSLRIAEAFQGAMLASIPRVHGEFELACTYYAAMQNAELGGDFYDLINFPDGRIGLVIADVSGKGLDAAIFTAQGKYTLRAFAFENPDPASVLTRTNSAIVGTVGDMGFITAFYGLLDPRTGKLTYAVAGHPAPLVAHADGQVTWLPTENREPPMGILSDIMYQQVEFTLNQGETLLCYTDGITEARRSGEMFDIDRLADLVKSSRELSPDDIARAVYQAVLEYSHGKIQDDIALMIAKRSNF
jgi:serine phosphatase RsbU (regulator of sigma subunit)